MGLRLFSRMRIVSCGRGVTTSIRPIYYAFVNRHERLLRSSWLFTAEWLYNVHASVGVVKECYLVDPASSHMLVSKIKPCMCKYELIQTVKLRMAH